MGRQRFNRTLLDLLGTCTDEQKRDWKKAINPVVHAYNCTRHASIGYSPFSLMLSRKLRLPVDLVLGVREDLEEKAHEYKTYISDLAGSLEHAYKVSRKNSLTETSRGNHFLLAAGCLLERLAIKAPLR